MVQCLFLLLLQLSHSCCGFNKTQTREAVVSHGALCCARCLPVSCSPYEGSIGFGALTDLVSETAAWAALRGRRSVVAASASLRPRHCAGCSRRRRTCRRNMARRRITTATTPNSSKRHHAPPPLPQRPAGARNRTRIPNHHAYQYNET